MFVTNMENLILFLGDVVPFKPIKFKNNYTTVINLECPIIKNGDPGTGKINLSVEENYLQDIFNDYLFCVNLGNNHILDYGSEGINSTIRELKRNNINYFGLTDDAGSKINPLILEFNSIRIAFIAVVCSSTSPLVEYNNRTYLSLLNTDEIISEVGKIRNQVERIVVYIHWGREESSYPEKKDILSARKLIDGGVDIVIGSHAHVPQPIEKYKNGIIAYNLGNFIMPEFKELPSYFDEKGVPQSVYTKSKMLWNRISWGLLVDMKCLDFRLNKYLTVFDRVIQLKATPFDRHRKLRKDFLNDDYDKSIENHLRKRERIRKIIDFLNNPHIPQRLKLNYGNWTSIKFR
jgi:poly-gamma-glutamate synthesis protein (capsule biosynthesis protein)